jgi:very-short-patch-repair endonuclease
MRRCDTMLSVSRMSCLLRHGARSPADLPGTGVLHAKAISSQQLKFQALLGERAHFMRHNLTETESILWRQLSGKKLGVAFRRQVPIGRYIADFVAPTAKLIVEVDDRSHELKRTADSHRDRNLERLGYRVLRVPAELVRANVAEAVARIAAALTST